MIQLDDAISEFLVTLNGLRQNVTYDANNRPIFAEPTPFMTTGSIQESTPKDLQLLPEGEYSEEVKVYYSQDVLLESSDDTLSSDQIQFEGQTYKVTAKASWDLNGYFRYLLTKLDPSNPQ